MDSPPKLSGETLIVHHIPLMHCQVSGGHKGGCTRSLLRDAPFIPPENLGLSRTTSLPERDLLHGEALLYSSLFPTSNGTWVSHHKTERKSTRGDSMASDSSSFTSSNSEDQITAHTLPRVKSRQRPMLRHNPFFCRPDGEEDEGDGLNGYQEDCSFELHGDTTDFHSYSSEPFHLHSSRGPVLSPLEPQRPLSSGSNVSMDCGEHDWADDEEDEEHIIPHGCGRHCESQAYGSDSSCNSSDGVLVNFSAIYSKLNNAVPEQPQWCGDTNQNRLPDLSGDSGTFYLDLHCSPTEPTRPQLFPLLREPLLSTSSSCSAEHQAFDLDANCNSCPPSGHSDRAPCVQSQAPCVQSQARLVVATQNYYKLVTCDLPQSSPSPAPSSTNSSDEQSRGSPTPSQPHQPNHYYLFRQQPLGLEEEEAEEEEQENAQEETEEEEQDGAGVEGQLYVNKAPRRAGEGRPRSRSYDRSLDVCQGPPLASLERMLSCPMRLSEGGAPAQTPPPRVTSFAEIARSKRRAGAVLHSPSAKSLTEPCHATASSHYSADHFPIQEHSLELEAHPHSQGPATLTNEGPHAQHMVQGAESSLVRYSKEQRPTTLPIQPFTFQHQFSNKAPRALVPMLPVPLGHMAGVHSSSGSGSDSGGEREDDMFVSAAAYPPLRQRGPSVAPPDGSVRPSPLGSYSPAQLAGTQRSVTSQCSAPLERAPQQSPVLVKQGPSTPPPSSLAAKRGAVLPTLSTLQGQVLQPADTLSPLGHEESTGLRGTPARCHDCGLDYLGLTEKPPEEFCLSPDTSSHCSSQPHLSVDLLHKKGLVKAVNTAVDLIVAHFGTTRNPDVKSKLGNSWVSPNVGHLILKYLCPALHSVLQDGLKPYVRDLIIGQRRCGPWSLVEASTQPGPSTRLLHSLFCKISQYSELTSPSMRLNAFIMGLLNLKSLELWFSVLHTHEDMTAAHYQPWGFLALSQGPCRALFEELLLLLQPLALLPFDLDLLFEPRLLQKGREHLRRKELLCGNTHSLQQSERSTFQLMRGRSSSPCGRGQARGEGEADPAAEPLGTIRGGSTCHKAKEGGQSGWWYQLMQSSQVYIDQSTQGSKFTKAERRKRSAERQAPPTREGVVEGAELGPIHCSSDGVSVVPKGRLSWMGSPPESALNHDRDSSVENQGLRWGYLFGATGSSSQEGRASRKKAPKSRAPSGWLHLDSSVFSRVAQSISAGSEKRPQNRATADVTAEPTHPAPHPSHPAPGQSTPKYDAITSAARASLPVVRALCHHEPTEPGHLSFRQGDVLTVLHRSDPDTLLCSRGTSRGLVSIVYVSLSVPEDSLLQRETQEWTQDSHDLSETWGWTEDSNDLSKARGWTEDSHDQSGYKV
ncbi:AP-4 complex accessory subunit RUSC2 isoform X2 [Boleophthalmus pectinirostris]|uniref:AP-4 complex accessory subunit RUSC2 isoform X2 n=1 Tax=Boleophthalmus pectinirostris TaxID=150288 RepID=UPI00242C5252|nr:AP-4 complex accessory subunit RUSC2 isoform X2 [Boleophthalmus pectinirostris]